MVCQVAQFGRTILRRMRTNPFAFGSSDWLDQKPRWDAAKQTGENPKVHEIFSIHCAYIYIYTYIYMSYIVFPVNWPFGVYSPPFLMHFP
jgi:hypothetical protein